jgi:hypothetical protein
MSCALLMTHQNMVDLLLLIERIIYWQDGPARIAKNRLHALLLHGPHQNFGTCHFNRFRLCHRAGVDLCVVHGGGLSSFGAYGGFLGMKKGAC